MSDSREQPLTCEIEKGQLVIRIGLSVLKHATENCPALFDEQERPSFPFCRVTDVDCLAKDVRRELLRENEDGEHSIHRMFDMAIMAAWEDGTLGIADDAKGGAQ